jgi:predicted nucleic acid-binding protein
MSVLVDTSVWVEYFRSGNNSEKLDFLIDENLIVTNDLILAELIPFLEVRKQRKLTNLLLNINKYKSFFKILQFEPRNYIRELFVDYN